MTAGGARCALSRGFDAGADGLARKSKELVINLLRHGEAAFARNGFQPGHVTCIDAGGGKNPREARILFWRCTTGCIDGCCRAGMWRNRTGPWRKLQPARRAKKRGWRSMRRLRLFWHGDRRPWHSSLEAR